VKTNYAGFLDPSVAQPPRPLQEFFALQPSALVLQPPLPLQEFFPAQACFSTFAFFAFFVVVPASGAAVSWKAAPGAGAAFTRVMVPPSRPVRAAVSNKEFFEAFMI
jgi:hypothetical protein